MSRSERKSIKVWDTKELVFARCGHRCVFVDQDGMRCTMPVTEAAHVLPQDTVHLARYGEDIIHHPSNMRGTCRKHNASVQINCRSRPLEADAWAEAIRERIEEEQHAE